MIQREKSVTFFKLFDSGTEGARSLRLPGANLGSAGRAASRQRGKPKVVLAGYQNGSVRQVQRVGAQSALGVTYIPPGRHRNKARRANA